MKKIKEAKNIEVFVNIRYSYNDDGNLSQKFNFVVSNKKYLDYITDKRYLLKDKIEHLISSFLLENFIERIDRKENVEIIYKHQERPENCIRKIQCYIPPYCGCKYCQIAEKDGNFIYCPEKNKHYVGNGIQKCPIFKSIDEVLT